MILTQPSLLYELKSTIVAQNIKPVMCFVLYHRLHGEREDVLGGRVRSIEQLDDIPLASHATTVWEPY